MDLIPVTFRLDVLLGLHGLTMFNIEADYYRYLAEFLDGDGQKEAGSLRISWIAYDC